VLYVPPRIYQNNGPPPPIRWNYFPPAYHAIPDGFTVYSTYGWVIIVWRPCGNEAFPNLFLVTLACTDGPCSGCFPPCPSISPLPLPPVEFPPVVCHIPFGVNPPGPIDLTLPSVQGAANTALISEGPNFDGTYHPVNLTYDCIVTAVNNVNGTTANDNNYIAGNVRIFITE